MVIPWVNIQYIIWHIAGMNSLKKVRCVSERRKELQKKGSRKPATGGNTSFTMQYEFSGMSERGILFGTH